MGVAPGSGTSEFKETKNANIWGVVAMVLGFLTTVGATVAEALGNDTKYAIVAGAVISVAGILQKTLVTLGYVKSRTELKSQ
jgi:hypothetical protein